MPKISLTLSVTPDALGVAKLPPGENIPEWAIRSIWYSITKTREELSVVCDEALIPDNVEKVGGWRCIKFQGPFDFSLTGILESVAKPLADARIGIFAMSTFNTDYVLVKQEQLSAAVTVLREAGHTVNEHQ